MNALETYCSLVEEWNDMYQNEPLAWLEERQQYISLLEEGKIEEFFTLVRDSLPLFSSIFVLKDGFLVLDIDCSLSEMVLEDFCVHLAHIEAYSGVLASFSRAGLFDRLVFWAFGALEYAGAQQKKVILEASLRMVSIPSGAFVMGASGYDEHATVHERPTHRVCISQAFEICRYPCTQELYESIMWENISDFKAATHPVTMVSWIDAVLFCNELSEQKGLESAYILPKPIQNSVEYSRKVKWKRQADGYRLPTEAEWEYCAKADQKYVYAGGDDADFVSWYGESVRRGSTRPIAQKTPNSWGLCDMSGNVHEWVWNWMEPYRNQPCTDPIGAKTGSWRSARGGSWTDPMVALRVSSRYAQPPMRRNKNLGFRVARNKKAEHKA